MTGPYSVALIAREGEALSTAIERLDAPITVRTARSVESVLEGWSRSPDVFVLEHAPTCDAFESLTSLREGDGRRPVVLLARVHDADVAARAVNEGVDRYVQARDSNGRTARAVIEAVDSLRTPSDDRNRKLERYETIVEASGDPVYTLDADGYVTFGNDALAAMTGQDLDDIVGEHVSAMMDEEHVERGNELIRNLLESEDRTWGTFEMDLRTADGDTVRCENHVALLPFEERFRGTVGILRDVTERKRRAKALQEERDRLSAVFETIPEPIVHVRFDDGVSVVENVNPSFVETFGLDETDLNGRNINEAIVPESVLDEARAIDASTETIDFVERTVQRKTEDGLRDFVLRATRFDVCDGERESIVAYLDITDQKERQRELERQNERLDQFASVVSHDLRNPLNVATGRVELARDDCETTHLQSVSNALDRMDRLIQNLLTLAKYGDQVTDRRPVDLGSMARSSWENIETDGEATLTVTDSMSFVGDPTRLRSLFENLLRNAIEHGGADVSIRVLPIEDGFAVEDDGPGLPDGDIDVFEVGASTNPDGTGFGLRIVEEIVEAHGWEIATAESREGGARFEITGVETPS